MKLSLDQMKEFLQLPSVKRIGGERQLRLVADWMDGGHSVISHANPVDQFDNLLSLIDLKSMPDDVFYDFLKENHVIITNDECRYFMLLCCCIQIWNWLQQLITDYYLIKRQRLLDSLKKARRATPKSDLLLVKLTEWEASEAILRSVTEFQPSESLRMSIPYRPGCADSFANGGCIFFSI